MIAMIMKCIACGAPTILKYRKGEIEAAFCGGHVPDLEYRVEIRILVRI